MTPDRARILELEAENAELREELAAWRANDKETVRRDQDLLRQEALRQLFKPGMQGRRCNGSGLARLAMAFMARPGHVFSREALIEVITDPERAPCIKRADVEVCNLRRVLRGINAPVEIVSVWGMGYSMTPAGAARLRALTDAQP